MKLLISYVLYYLGDMMSVLLRCGAFGWLYPLYNWLMLKSMDLDVDKKIWKAPEFK